MALTPSGRRDRAIDQSNLTREPLNTTTPFPHLPTLFVSAGLAVASTGCAIQTPHLKISQWPVTKRAMYYHEPLPYRLAVLPLLDERPTQERQGQKAPAMFLLLWNRRVGDYYTGDHVFGGEVVSQLTGQLVEYLRVANIFPHVEHVVPQHRADTLSPERVQQLTRTAAADYLLTGNVEHFFGSQHQHLSMFVLPLYFINTWGWQDSKTLPWGQTTMRFILYDGGTGDIAWRQRMEGQHTLPRETDAMSEAALESFALVAGKLATELRGLPLESLRSTTTQ